MLSNLFADRWDCRYIPILRHLPTISKTLKTTDDQSQAFQQLNVAGSGGPGSRWPGPSVLIWKIVGGDMWAGTRKIEAEHICEEFTEAYSQLQV